MSNLAGRLTWSVNKEPYYVEYNGTVAKAILIEPRGLYVLTYDSTANKA